MENARLPLKWMMKGLGGYNNYQFTILNWQFSIENSVVRGQNSEWKRIYIYWPRTKD
jgi:hypothetical protein